MSRTRRRRLRLASSPNLNGNVLLMKMKGKIIILAILAVLALYVVGYAILSSQGQYVPGAWGGSWVKQYVWAPRGFVSGPAGTQWHRLPVYFFLPAWWVDQHFVHTLDRASEDKVPINRTLDEAFRKGREQNQRLEAIGDPESPQPQP